MPSKDMTYFKPHLLVPFTALLLVALAGLQATAHFVWLDTDRQGEQNQALFFFGESPLDRNYHLPESLSAPKVVLRTSAGKETEVPLSAVDTDDFVGEQGDISAREAFVLESACRYGVYHGTLLTYFAKTMHSSAPLQWKSFPPSDRLKLEIIPAARPDGLLCTLLWQGQPLADAKVHLVDSAGGSHHEVTDQQGQATLAISHGGTLGLYANWTDKNKQGEHAGEQYTSATYYATLSLQYEPQAATSRADQPRQRPELERLACPPLPEPIASFGGAVLDGWLYCYSGHTGRAHSHSKENISQYFWRIHLDGGQQWEELPMQTPLQGLALVAYDGHLYRVGGMSARNAPDEDDDLHSVTQFARFNPQLQEWSQLAPLPEPRSSHDAVVIGDKLYVVGGWKLDGPGHGQWLETAWVYDLSDDQGRWQSLPTPPFKRRALAAAHWRGKLVAIAGMTEQGDVSRRVDFFDPASGKWSTGPDLPGDGIHGFGVSAWNAGGVLFASGLSGIVYRLSDDGANWMEAAQLTKPRFFHRLLPAGDGSLVAVAGASMEFGHLAEIERISIAAPATQ